MPPKLPEKNSDTDLGIRDLSDLCERWVDLRKHVSTDSLEASGLTKESLEVVNWLVHLADKSCSLPGANENMGDL